MLFAPIICDLFGPSLLVFSFGFIIIELEFLYYAETICKAQAETGEKVWMINSTISCQNQ